MNIRFVIMCLAVTINFNKIILLYNNKYKYYIHFKIMLIFCDMSFNFLYINISHV